MSYQVHDQQRKMKDRVSLKFNIIERVRFLCKFVLLKKCAKVPGSIDERNARNLKRFWFCIVLLQSVNEGSGERVSKKKKKK